MTNVVEITNQQYLTLESLYSKYMYEENADRNWSIDAVSKARDAFYDFCTELGVSADIGQKLACYVNANIEYVAHHAAAEKALCAASSVTEN